jgi:polyisoprenoid-binding protein YceI
MAIETWQLDSAHSNIGFSVRHMVISKVHGRFQKWSGTLAVDKDDLARSSVEAHVEVASLDTNEAQRDGHLKSADFFDAEKHPEIVFKSRSVQRVGAEGLELVGDLTIKGTTREIVLTGEVGFGKDPWGNERLGASAQTTIDRKDFGLTWNQVLETGGVLVGEKVEIKIEIEAIRPKT